MAPEKSARGTEERCSRSSIFFASGETFHTARAGTKSGVTTKDSIKKEEEGLKSGRGRAKPGGKAERGWAKREKKDYVGAIADFSRAIELNPEAYWAYGGRGQMRRLRGDYAEAMADLTRAIELDPSYTFGHCERGWAEYEQGDYDGALAAFTRAIELDSGFGWAHQGFNALAWTRATSPDASLRDPAGAVELARKAVAWAPTDANFRNTLAAALYSAGRYEEAVQALEKAGELRRGGNGYDWFVLAMVRHRLGKDDARQWYDKAVAWAREHNPDETSLRRLQAQAAEVLGLGAGPGRPAEGAERD